MQLCADKTGQGPAYAVNKSLSTKTSASALVHCDRAAPMRLGKDDTPQAAAVTVSAGLSPNATAWRHAAAEGKPSAYTVRLQPQRNLVMTQRLGSHTKVLRQP